MADNRTKLKDAGLQDVDELPDNWVEELSRMSDEDLAILAGLQKEASEEDFKTQWNFGGFIF